MRTPAAGTSEEYDGIYFARSIYSSHYLLKSTWHTYIEPPFNVFKSFSTVLNNK